MKKKSLTILFITLIALVPTLAIANQPGTEADPLISRSYLEQRLAAQASGISDEMLNFLIQDITRSVMESLGEGTAAQAGGYTPVHVSGGQILIGGEGTEIILRSGTATAFTEVSDGIVNATTGFELFNGAEISPNHVLIVPRYDGRGVAITSSGAWFIIRGPYTIR